VRGRRLRRRRVTTTATLAALLAFASGACRRPLRAHPHPNELSLHGHQPAFQVVERNQAAPPGRLLRLRGGRAFGRRALATPLGRATDVGRWTAWCSRLRLRARLGKALGALGVRGDGVGGAVVPRRTVQCVRGERVLRPKQAIQRAVREPPESRQRAVREPSESRQRAVRVRLRRRPRGPRCGVVWGCRGRTHCPHSLPALTADTCRAGQAPGRGPRPRSRAGPRWPFREPSWSRYRAVIEPLVEQVGVGLLC
jgi:hypothetical protein